jgi:hypothetical protein
MRRLALLSLASVAAAVSAAPMAEAQSRRVVVVQQRAPVVLTVRPRSFLDAGRVAPVGSQNLYASGQIQQYVNMPPYHNMRDRFGEGVLPDAIHGPFVGARNPFGPGIFQQ